MEQLFETMELNRSLVDALRKVNITEPTEIQSKVIPEAQRNKDLIIQSETGTGKTLAYLLPLFEKIDTQKKEMQAIILVPTHELAIQVERQIELLSQNSELKATSTPVIGDVNIQRQVEKLKQKPNIIVGTAGRILELIQKKKISAHTIKTIIIDEADKLLDDSYIEGTKAVVKTTLKERQILICSASISARTIERARLFMKEPLLIRSTPKMQIPDAIEHIYLVAEQRDKIEELRKLIRAINPQKAIAFCGSGYDIEVVTGKLKYHKINADSLHGSNVKLDRKRTMDNFKSGKLQILIATDIAARGLDIEGITHIINLDIPERTMEYLHRAGRTGRNGKTGMTISIVTEKEIEFIKQYERELNIKIIPKLIQNGVIMEYKKSNAKNKKASSGLNSRTYGESGSGYKKNSRSKTDGRYKKNGYGSSDSRNNSEGIHKSDKQLSANRGASSKPKIFRKPK
ncbi:superfamily II DNA/RNA helicase [Ruminiclostridium sufflavum DSM 19573]|uniref:Superfamily II DNA/RNA helicase n=1 Tax=Ruminiclostridium sufflavum DSM 19573 TaxID=1121337 RepID=A0A318XRR6_9FIRM|nr:DEAD/DEAH box helicase [Ruminiclostridium sufflavum]PYG89144.1 superfamily II DNA/RNA helicase [Ruminiclostridium sufflavum DSM 19573]